MIGYTCEAATQAKLLNRVLVSTDSEEILAVCEQYGVSAPFMRSPELAQDVTLIMDVLLDLLEVLKNSEDYTPEAIVLLQPTSPLRTAAHIDEALSMMVAENADTVVSVVEVPHEYTPTSLMKIKMGNLVRYEGAQTVYRKQDKPKFYARNGPAILAIKTESLCANQSFYQGRSLPYIMPHPSSIDIDNHNDLKLCEFYLRERENA